MSFRTNSYQQLSLTDSFSGLTFRVQKALEHSWAKSFAEDIFPFINEKPFEDLYSSNASRPNTPVNICIGALIIKGVFSISDDGTVENLMLDPRYQYALHTTSCEEQPLSGKALSRFRKRCYDYGAAYGIDLLHNCITGLSGKIAKMMDLNPRTKRMDSMMLLQISENPAVQSCFIPEWQSWLFISIKIIRMPCRKALDIIVARMITTEPFTTIMIRKRMAG